MAVRKAAHGALAKVTEDIEKLRFNRCIAHIYELANALNDAIGNVSIAGGADARTSPSPCARPPTFWCSSSIR